MLSNDGALRVGAVPKKLGRDRLRRDRPGDGLGLAPSGRGGHHPRRPCRPSWVRQTSRSPEAQEDLPDKQGLKFEFGVKVGEIKRRQEGRPIAYTNAKGEAQARRRQADRLDRPRPNTIGLNPKLSACSSTSAAPSSSTATVRTNLPGVWAVGDVVRGPMLAHKAEEEGVAVAERIAGQHGHVNFNTIPWVIYTSPEIAWVGRTEQQLKADGVAYKAGRSPSWPTAAPRALGDTTGFGQVLADARPTRSWAYIVGPMASELIAEAVVAMEFRASAGTSRASATRTRRCRKPPRKPRWRWTSAR